MFAEVKDLLLILISSALVSNVVLSLSLIHIFVKRDEDDRNREISPLREAEDAVHLDTSDMTIEQAVEAVLSICRQKGCL